MIHTYNVTGMTCGGCRSTVEKALNSIDGIEATVSLNPPTATIKMEKHIPTEQLQEALKAAGHYTISVGNLAEKASTTDSNPGKNSCC